MFRLEYRVTVQDGIPGPRERLYCLDGMQMRARQHAHVGQLLVRKDI